MPSTAPKEANLLLDNLLNLLCSGFDGLLKSLFLIQKVAANVFAQPHQRGRSITGCSSSTDLSLVEIVTTNLCVSNEGSPASSAVFYSAVISICGLEAERVWGKSRRVSASRWVFTKMTYSLKKILDMTHSQKKRKNTGVILFCHVG